MESCFLTDIRHVYLPVPIILHQGLCWAPLLSEVIVALTMGRSFSATVPKLPIRPLGALNGTISGLIAVGPVRSTC